MLDLSPSRLLRLVAAAERIRAEAALLQLAVSGAAQAGGDNYRTLHTRLVEATNPSP